MSKKPIPFHEFQKSEILTHSLLVKEAFGSFSESEKLDMKKRIGALRESPNEAG